MPPRRLLKPAVNRSSALVQDGNKKSEGDFAAVVDSNGSISLTPCPVYHTPASPASAPLPRFLLLFVAPVGFRVVNADEDDVRPDLDDIAPRDDHIGSAAAE